MSWFFGLQLPPDGSMELLQVFGTFRQWKAGILRRVLLQQFSQLSILLL
jgi:hypothetical protein